MKQLFTVIRKDLKLFFRDRKNLALVILTPIIIMFVLGNVFGEATEEEYLSNIKFGLCSNDPGFELPYSLQTITFGQNCVQQTESMVRKGELSASLTVPNNFYEDILNGYGSNIFLYLDNAKGQTAFTISTAIEAMVSELNEEIGVTFIKSAWVNLQQLNTKLKFVVEHLEGSKEVGFTIKERAEEMFTLIDDINLTIAYDYLDKANSTVQTLTERLNNSILILDKQENISNYTQQISKNTDILKDFIGSQSSLIDSSISNMETIYNTTCVVCAENCTVTIEYCEEINSTLSSLKDKKTSVEDKNNQLLESITKINNLTELADKYLAEYSWLVGDVKSRLEELSVNITNINDVLVLVNEQVNRIEKVKNEAQLRLIELHGLVINFTNQVITLQDDLNKTTLLLDTYTSKDPQNIVRAVTLVKKESFKDQKRFSFIAPGLVLVVLLLITLLISSSAIVQEKRSGTMLRNMLSPMSLTNFMLQKVVYLLILCFIQLALMSLVILFFKISYLITWQLILVLILASVAFISIGVLIGTLSRSENTSLLSSLVLVLPMMFLSGVFFPFESMPSFMASLGGYLPLTLALNNVEKLAIYHTAFNLNSLGILLGITVVFFFLAVMVIKRNPSVD